MDAGTGWIRWDPDFVYPIHHAEHARLDPKQRLAVQHYTEMVKRLVGKRDAYFDQVDGIPPSALGIRLRPDAATQDRLFDLSHSFFAHLYDTLSALASIHGRVKIFQTSPSIKGVEAFLEWWNKDLGYLQSGDSHDVLLSARNFRTVLAHPQQKAVFDWGTHGFQDSGTIAVVLFGEQSSKGNVPEGAARHPDDASRWYFQAPDMNLVLAALQRLTSITFHTMVGQFPLSPEEETCTWEADGFGSSFWPRLAEQIRAAARLDVGTRHLVDPHPWFIQGVGMTNADSNS